MIVSAVLLLFKFLSALLFVLTYETKDVKLNVISRNEWNAKPINSTLDDLILPIKRIIIIHTATNECNTKDECISSVQELQTLHLSPDYKFSDIGYNFLIGGDGNVYEGRGWYKQGAHTAGYNRGSIGIGFIGYFNNKLPNDSQITAVFPLIANGIKLKILADDYIILGASQLRNTISPGHAFMELIKTWPHSSEMPKLNYGQYK